MDQYESTLYQFKLQYVASNIDFYRQFGNYVLTREILYCLCQYGERLYFGCTSAFIIMHSLKKKSKKRNRRFWMRPYLALRGSILPLCNELNFDDFLFKNFSRMSREDFELLLNKVSPMLTKQTTCMREPISVPLPLFCFFFQLSLFHS